MYVMQPRLSKTMRLGVFEQFFCQGCAFFFWGGFSEFLGPQIRCLFFALSNSDIKTFTQLGQEMNTW